MMTYWEEILTNILDCGTSDLCVLEKCNYDFCDIKEELGDYPLSLNNILYMAIRLYKGNLEDRIDTILSNLEEEIADIHNSYDITDRYIKNRLAKLQAKKEELDRLNPFNDIGEFVNYIDTHIYFECKDEIENIYYKYLSDIIQEENENIGFVNLDFREDR